MQVLFRAEVVGIQNMSNNQAELLTEIDGRYYAIGFYSLLDDEHGITDLNSYYWKVKGNTKSINFENMIDKNGKKIFASLSEDGIGGDEVEIDEYGKAKLKIEDGSILCEWIDDYATSEELSNILYKNRVRPDNFVVVIGIHKG